MVKKINLDGFYRMFKSNIFILFLFAIFSLLSASIMAKTHRFYYGADIIFHWARINDIRLSIVHGLLFNNVSLNGFNQNGSAVMSMYPKINLLPIVFLSFFIKSFVKLLYVIFILRNFFSLVISYFSCLKFTKSKGVSYIFSISYTLSTFTLFYCFKSMDMGVSSSLIYLPLVFFGSYELLKNNKWKELTLGISAVMFCHIITAIMSIVLVFIILCVNYKKSLKVEKIISLFKAIISTVLITAIFWIPFLIISANNSISMPYDLIPLEGINYNEFVEGVFNNGIDQFINVFAFLGIVLSIINYKKLSIYSKQMFWISVTFLILSTKFFPWNLLRHTFLEYTFQFPYRLLVISQILFIYLFSEQIVRFMVNKNVKSIIIIVLSLFILCVQLTAQKDIATNANNSVNNNIMNSVNSNVSYYTDYFPEDSVSLKDNIANHWATYGNNKKVTVHLLGNGKFAFKLNKTTKSFKLPFLIYNSINYQIKVDGRNTRFYADDHSQLTLGHMNKGKHIVQVIVHKSWYDYLSYVLSVIGVMVLVFAWVRLLILKRNK